MSGAEDLTYEQLAAARVAAKALLNSGVLFIMDRERMNDLVRRLDSILKRVDSAQCLKRERDAYRAERESPQTASFP
jgi:hypothetical protein